MMKFRQSLLIFTMVASLTLNLHAPFMTITLSGDYDISGDISYSPAVTNDSIIRISANNVRLNLGGHAISQGNLIAGLDGIIIDPNLTNIIIQNGYIQNVTDTGIGVGQGCSRITIDNIVTFSCDNRGINVSGVLAAPIKNSVIKNCAFLNCCQGAARDNVLTLSHCVNLQVKDCFFNQNGDGANQMQSTLDCAKLVTCTKCEFFNLEANDNTATSAIHVFNVTDSYQCLFKNCITDNTSSAQSDAYGAEIDGMGNVFQSNLIQNTYCTATTSSNTVAGISLKSTASGNQILDNNVTNSFALSSASSNVFAYGIQMQNSLNTLTSAAQFVTGITLNAVAWSPNGRYLATADLTTPFDLRIYEFTNNTLVPIASTVHGAAVNSVAWSPDGSYIALGGAVSGGAQFRVFQFTGTSLTAEGTFAASGTVNSIAWSPSGRFIAIGTITAPQLQVVEFQGTAIVATAVATFTHGAVVNKVAWSSDEKYIALGGVSGTGTITTRAITFTLSSAATTVLTSAADFNHGATVSAIAFSPNNRFVAMGGATSGGVTLRALAFNGSALTASNPSNISTGATVNSTVWTSDGRFLASGQATGGGAEVRAFTFDGTTLVQAQTFTHGANVNGVDWSIGGLNIALGGVVSTQELKVVSALSFAENNSIQRNSISNIRGGAFVFGLARGQGISTSAAKNLVIQNNVFNGNINYCYTNNVFKQYNTNITNAQPSTFANLSFPPL